MKTIRIVIAALVLTVSAGQAQAEFVVKRFPCKDLLWNGALVNTFYDNETGVTKFVHIQITRNRCRPKDIVFSLGVTPDGTAWSFRGTVTGKFPKGMGFDVQDGWEAVLFIDQSLGGVNAKGTIDFSYSVE
jgi:hypothetical protein